MIRAMRNAFSRLAYAGFWFVVVASLWSWLVILPIVAIAHMTGWLR